MKQVRAMDAWGAAGVVLAVVFAGLVLPVIVALAGAFVAGGGVSAANLVEAFSDPSRQVLLLRNSLLFTAGTVAVALAVGAPVGFLVFRAGIPFRRIFIVLCVTAACVPLYVTATCWMALFGMNFWLYNTAGAAWISGIAFAPLAALITGAGFASAGRDAEEAALLDAGRAGVFLRVTLPAGLRWIAAAAAVTAALSVWDITVTDILVVRTYAEEVFTQFQLGAGPGRAAAVALPVMVATAALSWLAVRLCRPGGRVILAGTERIAQPLELGRGRWIVFAAVACAAALFLLVPFAALVRAIGAPRNLVTALRATGGELAGTLVVTPVAATVCVIIAIWAARLLARRPAARLPVAAGLLLLAAVPAPLAGIGIIELLNRPGPAGAFYDTRAILVFACVMRSLPFAALAMLPAMLRIPAAVEESVALEGGSRLDAWRRAILPMCGRDIAIAWLLSFIISVSELGASFLVVPPGRATLTIRFFTLIHYGVYPDAAAACLLLLAIVGIAAALMIWLAGRGGAVSGIAGGKDAR